MSADAVLWIVMAFCLIVGCPIFVSLGVASTLALILTNIPMRIVALDMLKVMDMFPLLAVVGFIFAGALMEKGGMARQIVDVASLFVGRIRGGLGITTILGCLFFAAMIGSGPGTVAAMGSIMIPTMVRRGYSPEYAAGVCATGGTLGILIPPSNPMIIYGIIANTSIAALFTAGFVPGFVLGLMMMLMAYFLARRAGFTGTVDEDKGAHFWPMFRKNFFSLMAPVIILGSIYAGICTPVEASVVAVFYALFVGTCITRELKIIQLWDAIKLTNVSAGSIIIVLGVSTLFGRILTMQRIPHQLANAMITLDGQSVRHSGAHRASAAVPRDVHGNPRHHRHPRAYFPAPDHQGRHRSRVLRHLLGHHQRGGAAFAAAGGEPVHCPKPVGHQLRAGGQGRFPLHDADHLFHHNADPVAGSALVASAPDGAILV